MPTIALVLALVLAVADVSGGAAQSAIVGTWRGTSTCMDKVAFPACNDEVVIYEVQALPAPSDSVTVRADKVVAGVRDFMGEFHFGPGPSGTWRSEFRSARYHGRWTLTVEGSRMTGTLIDLPSGRPARRVSLERVPG